MSSMLLALVPAVLLAPVPKDLEAQIKWRLNKGDVFFVTTEESSAGTVGVGAGAAEQKVETRSRSVCKYEVISAEPGKRVVKVTYQSCRVESGAAGQPLVPAELNVAGAALTLTLDEKFEAVKVEGFKEFAEKFGGRVGASAFGAAATEKGVAEGLRQVFAVVPPKGVNGGAKWEQKSRFPMGDFGLLNRTAKCTAADLKDRTGHVVIDTVADYGWVAAETKGEGRTGGITVVSADVKAEKCKGSVTFDPKKGRLVSCTEEIPFAGTMSLKAGDNPIDLTMKLTSTRTLTLSDAAPAK